MNLHGSIEDNLRAAVASARRLQTHPVHPDTLQFWLDLLGEARAGLRDVEPSERNGLEQLTAELQSLVSARERP
jgi:hypothetical protein